MTTQPHQSSTKIEAEMPEASPLFLKKAVLVNIVILGFALIGVALVVHHLNPRQAIRTLSSQFSTLEERIAATEEKVKLYETSLNELTQKLDLLASQQTAVKIQEIESTYQKLINEFKVLMENQKPSQVSLPLLEKQVLFRWFSNHINIKEIPNHKVYSQAYEFMKQGNLRQAIDILKPLAQDSTSPLVLWLEKASTVQKSLSIED